MDEDLAVAEAPLIDETAEPEECRSIPGGGRLAVARPSSSPDPTVWIVGRTANKTNEELASEWRSCGVDVRMIDPDDASDRLGPDDIAVGRIDVRRSVDGLEPGLLALHDLVRRGVHVVNRPAAILAAHDKLRTARALSARGLPQPRTAHLVPGGPVTIAPPLVVKPRFGSWGTDVYRCFDDKEVADVLEILSRRDWFRRGGAIVQEFVPNGGHDLRVLVAGGHVVGGKRRVAQPGEWRTNVYLGAAELRADPSPEARALALAAVDALGGDLFGVDLLPLPGNRFVVTEVNAAVEFDDVYSLNQRGVYLDVALALNLPGLEHSMDGILVRRALDSWRATRMLATHLERQRS
jgi:RimK family alpha-L-glutamate ligase